MLWWYYENSNNIAVVRKVGLFIFSWKFMCYFASLTRSQGTDFYVELFAFIFKHSASNWRHKVSDNNTLE